MNEDSIEITTSLVVGENDDNSDNFNEETKTSGFFLTPSIVDERPDDITGYVLSSQNQYGKVIYTEQEFELIPTPKVDVIQMEDTVIANGRCGTISTLDLFINTGDFIDIIVSNQYVSTDSTVLTTLEIDSSTMHLVSNVHEIVDEGTFTVRLSNYYNVNFIGLGVVIYFVVL